MNWGRKGLFSLTDYNPSFKEVKAGAKSRSQRRNELGPFLLLACSVHLHVEHRATCQVGPPTSTGNKGGACSTDVATGQSAGGNPSIDVASSQSSPGLSHVYS